VSPDVFRSMGVDVVVGGATAAELVRIRRLFDEWDHVFTRFHATSELSLVNAVPRDTVLVSPLFAHVVRVALDAARSTGGLVDPTLGVALEAAGYDRDFAALPYDGALGRPQRGRPDAVILAGRILSRPVGLRLDLNGVVKGMAVDRALSFISTDGYVSAGGDVAARGGVIVALPGNGSVRLDAGGIATSGSSRRRWTCGGAGQHHLIDASTGRPALVPWDEVTVAAGTCAGADVAAKAAFLLGWEGPVWLDERGLPGRFLTRGTVVLNDAWRASIEGRSQRVAA
jgi:FAD:protein FMN transferase